MLYFRIIIGLKFQYRKLFILPCVIVRVYIYSSEVTPQLLFLWSRVLKYIGS